MIPVDAAVGNASAEQSNATIMSATIAAPKRTTRSYRWPCLGIRPSACLVLRYRREFVPCDRVTVVRGDETGDFDDEAIDQASKKGFRVRPAKTLRMKRILWILCVGLFLGVTPSNAASDLVIAGEAVDSGGRCLTIVGGDSGTANRRRWATGYWPALSTPPVCSDTDPHFDPAITCVAVRNSGGAIRSDREVTAFISATGPGGDNYLIKIVDRPQGTDGFAVVKSPPQAGPCGAGSLEDSPVTSGGFTISGVNSRRR